MYLARKRINKVLHYFIRQSEFSDRHGLVSRELVHLGTDPSAFIVYPGGHAFYIHETVEQTIENEGVPVTQGDLEDIFWPFLKPDVKRALEPFRSRGKSQKRTKMTPEQQQALSDKVPVFDKRRLHYLKFGRMDQGYVGQMPGKLFRDLEDKSRDEIEQYFWRKEKQTLKKHELKTYVYVIFNLQRFFTSPLAKQYPESVNNALADDHFINEICRLNRSEHYGKSDSPEQNLDEYLIRYLIMYFDNDFIQGNIVRDFFKDFVNRHKRFSGYPQQAAAVGMEEAGTIFEVSQDTLNTIGKAELIRLYRRQAQKHHPDTGGEHDKFIRLTEAFHAVMRKRSGSFRKK